MDPPQAEPEKVINEIENIIGIEATDSVRCSAKTGDGISDILEELVLQVPQPVGDVDAPLQALIIDSWFDNYLGVVSLVRVVKGRIKKGEKIEVFSRKETHTVDKIGVFTPKITDLQELNSGQVGFICASIKEIRGAPVGDTIIKANSGTVNWAGFQEVNPRLCIIFPRPL
jgi:GTP-binding protein LepA